MPLVVFLRNRLKYALTADEVKKIVNQRLVKIDGKVRTDPTYPAGFMGKSAVSVHEQLPWVFTSKGSDIMEWFSVRAQTRDMKMYKVLRSTCNF